MEANEVALSGELIEVEPLRHTPAGIPLLGFKMLHRSQRQEAGFKRQVECEISGVAMAEVALAMARLKTGRRIRVGGFLNRKNRMSAQLMLHVTHIESAEEDSHGNAGTGQGQRQR